VIVWRNEASLLAFRAVLEDWDYLETMAVHMPDAEELARNIKGAFSEAYARAPCPLVSFLCQQGLETVDFEQVATELLLMISRQQENRTKRDKERGNLS
jgi:hypothetical protein